MRKARLDRIIQQIDVVIEAAMSVQAETGPDPDYRRAAKQELDLERDKLIKMIAEE